jgi:hypothetical protein
MKIDYKNAQQLCTATEFAVIETAKPTQLAKLTETEVKKNLNQARKLADKWREQAIKQGNSPASGESAQRSAAKAEIFTEVLARYERQLEKLQSPPADKKDHRPVAEKAAMDSIPAPPENQRRAGASGKIQQPDLAAQARARGRGADFRTDVSGLNNRVKGHVSARGRRSEAARDQRNPS